MSCSDSLCTASGASMTLRRYFIQYAVRPCLSLSLVSLCLMAGCDGLAQKGNEPADATGAGVTDPFTAAAADAEPEERPWIEASRPFLTAIAKRDYASAYGLLSNHARARTRPEQFVPLDDPRQAPSSVPLENLTVEQFVDWMQKMEFKLGVPRSVNEVSVFSIDPQVLSGQGDRLEVMFAIGGMPSEIPAAIRKASIRAAVSCQLKDETAKEIAAALNISEEQARAGNWPENDKGYDADEWPYLNVKFVLVEEDGQSKVGYFEFMPPSMLA